VSVAGTVNGVAVTLPTSGDTDNAATFAALLSALVGASASWLQFGAASGLTTSAVYLRPGNVAADSTEVLLVAPKAGKCSMLFAIGTSNAAGGNVRVTVRKNGSDTALTCDVLSGASAASDETNTFTVAAGDTLSVKALGLSGYTSGLANLQVSFAVTPS
jgi:hypothetical protein